MPYWTNEDSANGAPKFIVDATTGRTGTQEYGDTVSLADSDNPVAGAGSPGWMRVVKGTGKVTDVIIVSGGTGYANVDIIEVGLDTGTVETDEDGAIVSIDIILSGADVDTLPVVTVDTENGIGAEFTLVTEGRLGRSTVETLVASRTLGG